MLTTKEIEALKPGLARKLADQHGLYLYHSAAGGKAWRKDYRGPDGRRRTKTFGRWPDMGLAAARKANASFDPALECPSSARALKIRSFDAVYREWLPIKTSKLGCSQHKAQLQSSMEKFVLPYIGARDIQDLPRVVLVDVVRRIDAAGFNQMAHRMAGRMRMVLDYAVDVGYIENHAGAGLPRALSARGTMRPHACIEPAETGKLLQTIHGFKPDIITLGMLLNACTFTRIQELLQARWYEFNLDDAVWVIPAERMKMRKPHVVPLAKQVLALLERARFICEPVAPSDYVLQSPINQGGCIAGASVLQRLYRAGYKGVMTMHGFRALASTVLNESGLFSSDAIERQLAHGEKDAVRAAYHRAEYLDERRRMMQWYSDWLDQQMAKQMARA